MIWQRYRDIEGSKGAPEGSRGADRREGITRISGINQLGPQKLKFQVSQRPELIWQRYRDIQALKGLQRALIEQKGLPV